MTRRRLRAAVATLAIVAVGFGVSAPQKWSQMSPTGGTSESAPAPGS